jgi:glycine cleavage system H lipoate-binding protein
MILSDELRYTKHHLWVRQFGLTDYAEKPTVRRNVYAGITRQLKDRLIEEKVWYLRVGKTIDREQTAGIIYTENIHMDIIMPISGTIIQANLDFLKPPFWSNSITENDWIMIIAMHKPGELSDLMLEREYQEYVNNSIFKDDV